MISSPARNPDTVSSVTVTRPAMGVSLTAAGTVPEFGGTVSIAESNQVESTFPVVTGEAGDGFDSSPHCVTYV